MTIAASSTNGAARAIGERVVLAVPVAAVTLIADVLCAGVAVVAGVFYNALHQ